MYENILWNCFEKTGDISLYLSIKNDVNEIDKNINYAANDIK